ncbi:MAG: GNAT family N-acetyltransferase [Panacagrimonas sp.]
MSVELKWFAWRELDPDTLYGLLRLRSDVFVVEQNCVFAEMDGIDPLCVHLCAFDGHRQIGACLRLVPPGVKRPHSASPIATGPALGRLVTRADLRGTGLGRRLMQDGLARCARDFHGLAVFLSAQRHLEPFYASMDFARVGEPYDEDGIAHVDMRRGPRAD